MRIISPFKDYYDCIQSYYHDDMVYIRKPEWFDENGPCKKPTYIQPFIGNDFLNKYSFYKTINQKSLRDYGYKSGVTIYFCGKSYKPIIIYKKIGYYLSEFSSQDEHICYFPEDVEKYYPDVSKDIFKYFNRRDGKTIFEINKYQEKNDKIFIEKKCPIFVDLPNYRVYNGPLKDYGFQKVFPPAQAYQELMMYFGSVLAEPEKQIPKIDDVTMAEAKGFNKYSFRKDKSV